MSLSVVAWGVWAYLDFLPTTWVKPFPTNRALRTLDLGPMTHLDSMIFDCYSGDRSLTGTGSFLMVSLTSFFVKPWRSSWYLLEFDVLKQHELLTHVDGITNSRLRSPKTTWHVHAINLWCDAGDKSTAYCFLSSQMRLSRKYPERGCLLQQIFSEACKNHKKTEK